MKSRMRFLTVPTVGETYQYDGYENQVLMAPNYAESVAAVPMYEFITCFHEFCNNESKKFSSRNFISLPFYEIGLFD